MFNITDAARVKIEEALGENPGKYLRIVLKGYG